MRQLFVPALFAFVIAGPTANAFPDYIDFLPNGESNRCANCHINENGGGARNDFGLDVEDNTEGGEVLWSALFDLDSDGDGQTNGQELDDPCGIFDGSNASGGVTSNPGDDTDTLADPADDSCEGIEPADNDDCSAMSPSGSAFLAIFGLGLLWFRRRR